MSDQSDHNVVEVMKIQIQQLLKRNEALKASMETIQRQKHEWDESQQDEMDDLDPQPLSTEI